MDVKPIQEVIIPTEWVCRSGSPVCELLLQSLDEAAHQSLFSIQPDSFVRRRGQSFQSTTLKILLFIEVVCGIDCDLQRQLL
ncbi:hypothetical protein RvY_11960 [Ramazzottius varieornatus]|uniref:Uncharacterized protein n=1 Tax=Ramazzottius varieornatus TaxID=947166 RepID=A0A1D1VHT7_RAMVA|nr:hypothetical protein RvY_11960 [Ramazzottius varieornatus]